MITQKLAAKYALSPESFRAALVVDVDGQARKLGDVQDDWQRADFAALDPALMRCNGSKPDAPDAKMRVYLERPRGHSKTTDIAIVCCWAMAFAQRPIRAYAFAADGDQARLLKDAMETVLRLNPWLAEILETGRGYVSNVAKGHPGEGAMLEIFSSDVASSYGILPDLIVADELCHWEGDGSLWHSLISSAAKRNDCLLFVISNAGFTDSWQWEIREVARTDSAWFFSRLDGPRASWLTQARLDEQRRMLPRIAFARLWLNEWSACGGDALTPEDIEAAFSDSLQPMKGTEPGFHFVAGVDLGLTRDCSAVVVLAIPMGGGSGRIRLAHNRLWRPQPGRKIDLTEVEGHILALDQKFGLEYVAFDPWQAEHLSQRLETIGGHRRRSARSYITYHKPWMREITPTGNNLRAIASLTIESFQDRRFQFYRCEPLRRDLLKLRVEEKSYGVRLVSPRDGEGHGDSCSAFGNALLIGHELAGKKPVTAGTMSGKESSGINPALQSALKAFEAHRQEWES